MSSAAASHHQGDPWYRLVRCLVILLVASLERKIARLLAELDTLDYEDPRYDLVNAKAYYFEDLRDAYRAWLDDPASPLPAWYNPDVIIWKRRPELPRPRHAGARARATRAVRPAPTPARCTTTLQFLFQPPGGGASARP